MTHHPENPKEMNTGRDAPEKTRWYFRTTSIVVALCCIGPFALPLIWLKPEMKKRRKAGITLLVLLLTWGLCFATWKAIQMIIEAYQLLQSISLVSKIELKRRGSQVRFL
ncbi:MAG: hypothetical protein JXR25_09725 [Pontiellaceae bacterium]|nr:hypothetical protein [Pontiellaceae bacterium]MBN2785096.1 hypothetical protein [Pontiellaceae bacterium]